ncbi:hypothetical protein QBC43DRAFT_344407 [Cladorrhinum sp. PSN259]|nr:hypothetical protein QBC43DRAFT_344407 [Cladorrhinum sp. PSN259]
MTENPFLYALSSNNAWAGYKAHQNPQFFPKLASGQSPQILWLGCSDSRCPETTILGLQPGDVFVHRNIANIISPTDINTSAVIEYAVAHLKVKHIVLCGHTACGGAAASLGDSRVGGVLDTWLTPLKAVRFAHLDELNAIKDDKQRATRIAELNVEAGIKVLMANFTVQEAIEERGLEVHGCLFDIACGRIKDLGFGTKGGHGFGVDGSADDVVRVLTDDQIKSILENLTVDELQVALDVLRSALHEYSAGSQSSDSIHQPHRTSVNSPATGATTLFMPSSSSIGTGIKVITLSTASAAPAAPPSEDAALPNIKPTGAITLFSPHGTPVGFLHASTLTAFRTALASLCLVSKRDKVSKLMVFGTGEQAYWHVRLTLLLRGSTIKSVTFVNRAFSDSCRDILRRFLTDMPHQVKSREGWQETKFEVLTRSHSEYARLLEKELLESNVVFCCTPSTEPLWDGGWLTSREGRRRGRLIVAIGSWTPEMREIPAEVIRQALGKSSRSPERGHGHMHVRRHWHKHAVEGRVVVVDTLDGALKEAGELIEAGVGAAELVELGELVLIGKKILAEEQEDGEGKEDKDSESSNNESDQEEQERKEEQKKRGDKHLTKWLRKGNVIYKSVGLGLMDLTVGMHVVKLAKERGIGSHIEGF